MALSPKKKSRAWLLSTLRISHAVSGYLNLRIYELKASLTIVGGADFSDILNQGEILFVFHTRIRKELLLLNFGVARFVLIDERLFVEQSVNSSSVFKEIRYGTGIRSKLVEQGCEVDHG